MSAIPKLERTPTPTPTPTGAGTPLVDRLRPEEIDAAARMLARSFLGEGFFGWMFEGIEPDAATRAMTPWFRGWIRSYIHTGTVLSARLDGELVGVAVRTAPGTYPARGWAGVVLTSRIIRGVLRMAMTSQRARGMPAVADVIASREPDEPFWHLAWIGVAADHQRRGVGAALADESMRMIEERPATAWLLTFGEHTRRLYEARGFVVEGEIRPAPDGPVGWTLRKEV
jgi:ribosomal protein S18 acetylase RimI-like enzyme